MERNKGNVPKIRFPGFTDDWEQHKFGQIVNKYEDPVATPIDGYMRLGIKSHAKGTFHSYVEKGKGLETAKMFRVAANNFIVNITFGWEHAVAITDEDDAGKLVSHRFPQFQFRDGMVPKFFQYLILDERFRHYLELSSPGGAGRNRVLKLQEMLNYEMIFPSQGEQQKIGQFFCKLDNLITLHQRKLTHLQAQKKGLLQKMFPKEGERFPELRFPGFAEAWEVRKLGEVAEFSKGSGYSKDDLIDTGIPIILYGRLYTQYQTQIEEVNTFVKEKKYSVYSTGKEVIVPASGETAEDISIASAVIKSGILLGGDLNIIYPSSKLDSSFLALQISNGNAKKKLSRRAQGKSVVHLHNVDLQKVGIIFPSIHEQKEISEFLTNFDNLITLHQRKLTHLRQQKKALLQQMFV